MFSLKNAKIQRREMQTVHPKLWRNWSGLVRAVPDKLVYPVSIEDVVAIVKECRQANKTLRVVGAGHSFNRLVKTDDVIMSLDELAGLIEINATECTAMMWAGTRLEDMARILWQNGLALESLGGLGDQSIAGALCTATHGTGGRAGVISTQVTEITAVLGTGEVVTCSETSNADLFHALQVSLGTIGVIVKVKLQCTKIPRVHCETRQLDIDDCLMSLSSFLSDYSHFEVSCFPYSNLCQVTLMKETNASARHSVRHSLANVALGNLTSGALSFACRSLPSLCRPVSRFTARHIPVGSAVYESYELLGASHGPRFNRLEYVLPAANLQSVIREVLWRIEREQIPVHFPIQFGYLRGDNLPLSPANGSSSAYVAIHMYQGMPYENYFRSMEEVFLRHAGRPHWGSLHSLTAHKLAARYPEWSIFLDIRATSDPDGVFLNPYLEELLGVEKPIFESSQLEPPPPQSAALQSEPPSIELDGGSDIVLVNRSDSDSDSEITETKSE